MGCPLRALTRHPLNRGEWICPVFVSRPDSGCEPAPAHPFTRAILPASRRKLPLIFRKRLSFLPESVYNQAVNSQIAEFAVCFCRDLQTILPLQHIPARGRKLKFTFEQLCVYNYYNISPQGDGNSRIHYFTIFASDNYNISPQGDGNKAPRLYFLRFGTITTYPRKGTETVLHRNSADST